MPAGGVSACSISKKPSVLIFSYPVFLYPVAQGVSGDAQFQRSRNWSRNGDVQGTAYCIFPQAAGGRML